MFMTPWTKKNSLLFLSVDLCIPSNSSDFIVSISESLAQSEIHLTLEFLNEAFVGFLKSSESMRQLCLDYMVPWLKNLAVFARHSPDDHKNNLSKTKDVLRLLIDLTVRRVEVTFRNMEVLELVLNLSVVI